MRIAVVTSSGGSIFRQALAILKACKSPTEFIMISDRQCRAEKIAEDFSLPLVRIAEKDNQMFSLRCREYLDTMGSIHAVILFFSRLLTHELFDAYPCVNIHPALLPSFKGFHAIDQAYEAKVKFFGGTLHMVDEKADHGAILAQIQMPVYPEMTWNNMINAAFVQDVYLMLLLVHLLETGKLKVYPKSKYQIQGNLTWNDRANPCLEDGPYLKEIKTLQNAMGLRVI